MRVVQISAECSPCLKAGGLADVVSGLSRALLEAGHQVIVIVPDIKGIFPHESGTSLGTVQVELDQIPYGVKVRKVDCGGLEVWALNDASSAKLISRDRIYGEVDDTLRYGFFSKAALTALLHFEIKADVLHVHDWATALVPIFHRELFEDLGLSIAGTCLTLHNMESQGFALPEELIRLGLDGQWLCDPERMENALVPGLVNFLQGGIVFSDALTTVSPTYAEEILHPVGGRGLEKILLTFRSKLTGILNGLDFTYWNPATDPYLSEHFSIHDWDRVGPHRLAIKRHLQKRLELRPSDRPLIVTVSRLVPQKGLELLKSAIVKTLQLGGQYVLLGSSPIPEIHRAFLELKLRFSSCRDVHIHLQPEEALTHWMFASADFNFIPSIFEPCGLTQLIGMRYGAVPVVRETGGLKDTVHDVEYSHTPPSQRNGFSFQHADQAAVDWIIPRIFDWHDQRPEALKELRHVGMKEDHSWTVPSKKYLSVYEWIAS